MKLPTEQEVDTEGLASELRRRLDGEVRFDNGSRALYATDASNYRQIPLGVVIPRTVEDVETAVGACHQFGAPILSRGGGTSLSGQTCNVAVILDMSKHLNRILQVDPESKTARVEPGTVLDDVRDAAEMHNLTFGPDPATHNRCTIGGMIGNNSCGVHSVMAGKTDANVEGLDVLTYRGLRLQVSKSSEDQLAGVISSGGEKGKIYERLRKLRDKYQADIRDGFPDIPRRVSGFDLPHLLPEKGFNLPGALVGTEGTCVVVLSATLRLVHSPLARSLLVLGYDDIFVAADAVPEILRHNPIGLEGMDDRMVADMKFRQMHYEDLRLLPEGRGWLLVEFGAATREESDAQAKELLATLQKQPGHPAARLCTDQAEARKLWEVRESGLGASALVPGQFLRWPGWDDSAVAPDRMGPYLRDLQKLMEAYEYDGAFYGHFGEGCLHVRYNFDLTSSPGIAKFRSFLIEAADLVVSYGGSLSGEHGDGQSHGELLPRMYGPRVMEAFREFKTIWDPDWKMNPGKVIGSRPLDQDLRLGTSYDPPKMKTHFAFVEDGGSFAKATLRCVGVGKCRRHDGGIMCPSYMATREEEHSTRGRARLLFEMLEGAPLQEGWRNKSVRNALDLCLACKGCKAECPVNVDMASYKAEFLSHYYAGRLRPRSAYAFGLIYWWARGASRIPGVVNFLTQSPLTSQMAKRMAGIAPQRRLPVLAKRTFKNRASLRRPADTQEPKAILWPDTFNNYFHPETAEAALIVLEAAGFRVEVPARPMCCGRPLYDFGMLNLAKYLLKQILERLRPDIRAGVPVVVLEPSCAAVFRDELLGLLPDDEDAIRLSGQTFLLADFLESHAPDFNWPNVGGKAILHGHCHQKSLGGMAADQSILHKLGIASTVLDSGCCGMAGAFGFEAEHYDVSVACGERVLLPAVRETPPEGLIVSDGFSCREQIAQCTDRHGLHLAEVIQQGLAQTNTP